MKHADLEKMIQDELTRLQDDPVRALVSLMSWLILKDNENSRVRGVELASACIAGYGDYKDAGWKLYWRIFDTYKRKYGIPYRSGESDEDMGLFGVHGLKVIVSGMLNEVS